MLFLAFGLIGVLSISAMGFELRKRKVPPPIDAGLFLRFALLPGERHGTVWAAADLSGEPMIATITTTNVFALNFSVVQAPPVRLRPEGCVAAFGTPQMITPAATEPMVQVSLSHAGQPPMSFWIAHSGAKALANWAKPSS